MADKGMFTGLMEANVPGRPQPPEPPPAPEKEGSREVGREVGKHDGATQVQVKGKPKVFDINEKGYRKDSFLFTNEEFEAMEDLKLELRRRYDLKATKNDISRVALSELFDDYRRNLGDSSIVKHLREKLT